MAQDTGQAILTASPRRRQQLTVADAMVTRPTTHRATITVGELRAFFADDHVHISLLVDSGVLIATVERSDLDTEIDGRAPALPLARLEGRTISPHAAIEAARMKMLRSGRRRLAVTTQENALLGLLCLKKNGSGFCSDEDVSARRSDLAQRPERRRAEQPRTTSPHARSRVGTPLVLEQPPDHAVRHRKRRPPHKEAAVLPAKQPITGRSRRPSAR
jgi:hypothetical protein